MYHIKEFYGCTGTPNEGVRMHPGEIAAQIRRMESEDPMLRGKRITGIADPSIFDESRGESVARMMERSAELHLLAGGRQHAPGGEDAAAQPPGL